MATLIETSPATDVERASQWKLMWLPFRKHRLAMAGLVVVAALYFVAVFCEMLAPFDPDNPSSRDVYHPPQQVHFVKDDGTFQLHVKALRQQRDRLTLETRYTPDPN